MENPEYDTTGQLTISSNTVNIEGIGGLAGKLLTQCKTCTLLPDGSMDYETDKIRVPLKPHQRRSLFALRQNETLQERISPYQNYSLYCDNVGAGKSLTLLALIAKYPEVGEPMITNRFLRFTQNAPPTDGKAVGYRQSNNLIFKASVILVPHTIVAQWEGYIKNQTTLKYFHAKTGDIISKMTRADLDTEVILVKSTKWDEFMTKVRELSGRSYTPQQFTNNRISPLVLSNISKQQFNMVNINNMIKELTEARGRLSVPNEVEMSSYVSVEGSFLFERIIVDEAIDIRLSTSSFAAKFVWYVSSSVQSFIEGGAGCSNNPIRINYGIGSYTWAPYWPRLVIRNDETFVKDSFNLPPFVPRYVRCLTPKYMNVLNGLANANIISPEAMYALTGGDVRGAMELMGCEITDDEDVIESLIRNFKSKLLVRQRHMVELKERLKEREEASDRINKQLAIAKQRNNEADIMNLNIQHQKQLSLVSSAEESIKTETQHIKELEQKIADIKARVEVTNDKQCPICISDIDMPTLTPCCNNLFCGSCLLETLKVRQTCPLCRQAVDIKQIKGIEKGKKKKVKEEAGPAGPVEELPTKLEGLFNIIDNTPDGRFLIFTQFDHVFNADALVNMFANRGITYEYLKGSASHIANIVERFNSGRLKVLILNTRFLGSGINLQTATDTIIFHKLSDDIEKQVIGRAQRPGRTAPLRVHFLYYDNEFDWG